MHSALREIIRLGAGRTYLDAPLREHSRWRIGGTADLLVEPGSIAQVQILRRELRRLGLPHIVIGDGSNMLFDDEGIRGVVVKIGRALARLSFAQGYIDAQAGVFMPRLARNAGKHGMGGLEHTIGIPGTLGGMILMNGGSMQKGIGSQVERVRAVDLTGELVEFSQGDCRFAYRYSSLQEADLVIVEARLRCEPGVDPYAIREEMLGIMQSRRSKFPLKQPNCGSVFLSDPGMYHTVGPPGKIIEECGLKGFRVGDAMVAHQHANFIVNLGSATSSDIFQIIRIIRETVHSRTGYWLKCEARYVTPDCRTVAAHEVLVGGVL